MVDEDQLQDKSTDYGDAPKSISNEGDNATTTSDIILPSNHLTAENETQNESTQNTDALTSSISNEGENATTTSDNILPSNHLAVDKNDESTHNADAATSDVAS